MSKEKKLTDEKLVKASEKDCLHDIYTSDCETCHLFDDPCPLFDEACSKILPKAIKELIQRLLRENAEQKAKIERLTKENSNVISMNDALYREKAELQKQVDELENRFENKACCNMSENCSMVQQAVKYTAREILTELYETKFKMIGEDYIYADNIKVFAKKYGVEVK